MKKLLFALLAMTTFLLISFGLLPFIGHPMKTPSVAQTEIFITYNDIHTAITFKKDDAAQLVNLFGSELHSSASFIEFSFGDKDFFIEAPTWNKVTVGLVLDALFTPQKGIMHVDFMEKLEFPAIKISVTKEQLQTLLQFIEKSFKKENGMAIQLKNYSYYGRDRFFFSTYSYHLFFTCNNWTGTALNAAKVQKSFFTPYRDSVLKNLPSNL